MWGGGVCEAINENWLAACRIKDQLQPKSPPRRIYITPCVAVWDRSGLICWRMTLCHAMPLASLDGSPTFDNMHELCVVHLAI